MKRFVALFVLLFAIPAAGQQPPTPKGPALPIAPQAPAPPAPPLPPVINPESGGQAVNVRLDVTVTDQGSAAPTQPKTVMVILADRATARTRGAFEDRSISVDARPTIVDGRIRVNLTIESRPSDERVFVPLPADGKPGRPDPTLLWQNSFALLLDNGKR